MAPQKQVKGTAGGDIQLLAVPRWYRILYLLAMLLALVALLSFDRGDLDILRGGVNSQVANWMGPAGAWFSQILLLALGLGAYAAVLLFLLRALRLFIIDAGRTELFLPGTLLTLFGLSLLLGVDPRSFTGITANLNLGHPKAPESALSGGLLGQLFAGPRPEGLEGVFAEGWLRRLVGPIGTMILGWLILATGSIIVYISDWHKLLKLKLFAPLAAGAREKLRKSGEEDDTEPEEEEDEEPKLPDLPVFVPGEEPETPAPPAKPERRPPAPAPVSAPAAEPEPEEPEPEPEEPDGDAGTPEPASAGSKFDRLAAALLNRAGGKTVAAEPLQPPPVSPAELSPDIEPEADVEPAENPEIEPAPDTEPEEVPGTEPNAAPAPLRGTAEGTAAAAAKIDRMQSPDVKRTIAEKGKSADFTAGEFTLPPCSMLAAGNNTSGETLDTIEMAKAILQRTLDDFQLDGQVSGYISGPRITRYEITLAPGINVKKVEALQDNIAMNLSAKSVRVLAPIPGRNVVGVEIPNAHSEAVFLRTILESENWKNGKIEIPIALGKNVSGEPVVLDLARAPHMLIAGTTGTGKSVCSNSLIMSLLFRFRPDELRLIMVDPKIVEFDAYRRLPHLLTPIINDSSKVPVALRWAANEMDHRYYVMADAGVKKLSEFNHRDLPETPQIDRFGKPIPDKMPLIVIIIDELADLMMTEAKKDVETNIARIAQKGRAAGIHIIVATQRPSTNVVTGVIKANLPTRLCFQVRSLIDSRVVLDSPGAEKLLGTGDMLVMASTSMVIDRVQGAFVPDKDITKVVEFISDQMPQHFNDQVLAETDDEAADNGEEEEPDEDISDDRYSDVMPLLKKYLQPGDDEIMRRALEVILVDRKASTSYLQRRLKIGYNKSAEIMDQLQERGIVGPPSGSGSKRDILVFDGTGLPQE